MHPLHCCFVYSETAGGQTVFWAQKDPEKRWEISRQEFEMLLKADGFTCLDSYLAHDLVRPVEWFSRRGLLCTSHFRWKGKGRWIFTFPLARPDRRRRRLCRIIRGLMDCACVVGILFLLAASYIPFSLLEAVDFSHFGCLKLMIGILPILVIHETGHLICALAGGGSPDYFQVDFWWVVPTCAGVCCLDEDHMSSLNQMRYILGGLESEVPVLALLFLAGRLWPQLTAGIIGPLILSVEINLIENVLPYQGSDGQMFLEHLFQKENPIVFSRSFLFHPSRIHSFNGSNPEKLAAWLLLSLPALAELIIFPVLFWLIAGHFWNIILSQL